MLRNRARYAANWLSDAGILITKNREVWSIAAVAPDAGTRELDYHRIKTSTLVDAPKRDFLHEGLSPLFLTSLLASGGVGQSKLRKN